MSEPIITTIYSGDITRGLVTVRLDPKLMTGIKLGGAIGIVLSPQPEPDPLQGHPELPLTP